MAPEITHRDLTRAAARWILDISGIHAATYELAVDGGQADAIGVSTPDPAAATELRVGEYARAQQYRHDAYNKRCAKAAKKRGDLFEPIDFGSTSPAWLAGYRERSIKRLAGPSLVVIAECKRTRSDLLADLRAQKLRRYEAAASHCWLVANAEVVRGDAAEISRWQKDRDAAVAQLEADGLPAAWGIAIVGGAWADGVRRVFSIRDAQRLREPEPWEIQGWADRMLQSMCQRVVGARSSPMADEHDVEARR